jgi:hypothetical protein
MMEKRQEKLCKRKLIKKKLRRRRNKRLSSSSSYLSSARIESYLICRLPTLSRQEVQMGAMWDLRTFRPQWPQG